MTPGACQPQPVSVNPLNMAHGQPVCYPQQNGQYMLPVAPQTGAYQLQMYQGPPNQLMPQTAGGELLAAQYLISLCLNSSVRFLSFEDNRTHLLPRGN